MVTHSRAGSRGFSPVHLVAFLFAYFLAASLLFYWLGGSGLMVIAGLGLAVLVFRSFLLENPATPAGAVRQQRLLGAALLLLMTMAAGGFGLIDMLFRPAPTPAETQAAIVGRKENDARVNLANLSQSDKPEELQSAIKAHDELVRLGNPRLDGLNYRARALIGLKRREEGSKLYREWLTAHPGREGLSEFAHALYWNGYHKDALSVFKEALNVGENCEDLGGAGLCALALGDHESATHYSELSRSCEGYLSKQLRWAMQDRPDYSLFNFGQTGQPFSGHTPYEVMLSNDGGAGQARQVTITASAGGKALASKTVPALEANSRKKITLKLPSSAAGEVVLTVDPEDEIWESDENNNTITRP